MTSILGVPVDAAYHLVAAFTSFLTPALGGVAAVAAIVLFTAAARLILMPLSLRGLMCIPPEEVEPARQRAWFARLRGLRDDLNAAGYSLDTLSMGMSADFEAAIQEGATIVRLGTVLFGARPR